MLKYDMKKIAKKLCFSSPKTMLNNFLNRRTIEDLQKYLFKNYGLNYSVQTYQRYIKKIGIKYSKVENKWKKMAINFGYKDIDDVFEKYSGSIYRLAKELEAKKYNVTISTLYKRYKKWQEKTKAGDKISLINDLNINYRDKIIKFEFNGTFFEIKSTNQKLINYLRSEYFNKSDLKFKLELAGIKWKEIKEFGN